MSLHQTTFQLLKEIEFELKYLNLWSFESPNTAALASTEPFCCDTLFIHQWLQFILIPRLNALIDGVLPLPTQCEITPVIVESYKGQDHNITGLLKVIKKLDYLLTQQQ